MILFYRIEYLKYSKKQIYERELLCVHVSVRVRNLLSVSSDNVIKLNLALNVLLYFKNISVFLYDEN